MMRPLSLLVLAATLPAIAQEPTPGESKPVPDLIIAVRTGDHARVKELLAQGADPNVIDSPNDRFAGRFPAWMLAQLLGDEVSLKLMRNKGFPTEVKQGGGTALLSAVSRGDIAFAKALLERGVPADVVEKNGRQPPALQIAAAGGDVEMVRFLLEKGADPNLKDAHDDTALMAAARAGSAKAVQALLAKKASVTAKDKGGRTTLHWAVRSGDTEALKTLLDHGADVNVADAEGRTPLSVAAAQTNARMVQALRARGAKGEPALGTGAPASARAAVERSLPLLQRGAATWSERQTCISCHHQAFIVPTTALAKDRGFSIDEKLATAQVEKIIGEGRRKGYREARQGVDARIRFDFDGNIALRTGLFLSALLDSGRKPDAETEDDVRLLAQLQWVDGRWNHGVARIPIESSDIAATALAVRVLMAYPASGDADATLERLARAKKWLIASAPRTTDDLTFRLLGLSWIGADRGEIKQATRQLLAAQRSDGGWSQRDGMASDAYATGQALVALHQAGSLATTDEVYQRGAKYLLRTQEPDGSWLVSTRSVPLNAYFESGFPHGKFQFISFAGTCWATRALILAAAPPDRK